MAAPGHVIASRCTDFVAQGQASRSVTIGRNPVVIANEPEFRDRMKQSHDTGRLLRSTPKRQVPAEKPVRVRPILGGFLKSRLDEMERGRRCGGSQAPGRWARVTGGPSATFAPNRAEQGGTPFRSSVDTVPTREAYPTPRAHRSDGRAGHNYQAHEMASSDLLRWPPRHDGLGFLPTVTDVVRAGLAMTTPKG